MFVKTQIFFVLGISKSGYAVSKHILENGGKCYIHEKLKNERIDKAVNELVGLGAINVLEEQVNDILPLIDVMVISPGIPLNHEFCITAKMLGKRIIGELEYGYLNFSPPIVAVTGTNGKTTTVTLLSEIFKQSGVKSHLVGNVGTPLTQTLCDIEKDDVIVTEVSSFQLEGISSFCPHVSCVINIAPDHLERHYTMENYIFLKKRIFKNQSASEFCVLNFDDLTVKEFCTQTKAKVIWVSLTQKVDGAYRQNGKLYFCDKFIIDESKLRLKGEHNVCNALFAIACAQIMGVDEQSIANVLENFNGVSHRLERICEKDGVVYYNDSKATNTASTISALNSMSEPTILILGGSEKGESYDKLFEEIKTKAIKHVILTGASRYKMLDSAGRVGYSNLTVTYSFEHAVKIASTVAKDGDCVLLSPACASFDSFNNYQERGETFRNIVENL